MFTCQTIRLANLTYEARRAAILAGREPCDYCEGTAADHAARCPVPRQMAAADDLLDLLGAPYSPAPYSPAPMPGTFAAWLGDRSAEYAPHRAAPRPSTVPAGCPRGLGEGDRTRRIWTDPSGVLAYGDVREYGDMLADDRRRGYGRVLAGTGESCARSAGSAARCSDILPISGVSDPGACRAARAARTARQTAGATA